MEFEKYEISQSDFELVQKDTRLADKPLETKPTTFLKDALKRFAKNKSSIVGACILGLIIMLAIFLPIFSPKNIKYSSTEERFLAPKLFEPEYKIFGKTIKTNFWNGTVKYKDQIVNTTTMMPAGYYEKAVMDLEIIGDAFVDTTSEFGTGGFVVFTSDDQNIQFEGEEIIFEQSAYLYSDPFKITKDGGYTATVKMYGGNEHYKDNVLGSYAVSIRYEPQDYCKSDCEEEHEHVREAYIELQPESKNYGEFTVNMSEALEKAGLESLPNATLCFELKPNRETKGVYSYIMIESVVFSANETVENYADLPELGFTDANHMVLKKIDLAGNRDFGYWTGLNGVKNMHNVKVTTCNFTYDTYEKPYGEKEYTYALSELESLKKLGYCDFDKNDLQNSFEVLNEKLCPVIRINEVKFSSITGKPLNADCTINGYRLYKHGTDEPVYKRAPKFLFGTNVNGQDLVKKSFAGLRFSLLLGVATSAFCFAFGLVWGSISGYFGGTIDLLMERFCDILSGVPWIVIMTLAILKFGNNELTFVLALCLTGWMGTAGRTRTQFYRFKGREYVLASRTLGSSDFRLIFKHILPNSMGTIITSSVLMITSVIFSESTLAFLNLGLQGDKTFGVMMANNQTYLQTYPHLVVFPAVIISLMMISFNLFGNGLRDAFNPSLKGSE